MYLIIGCHRRSFSLQIVSQALDQSVAVSFEFLYPSLICASFFCCRHLRNIFKILFTDGCDKKRCDFYATCETDDMGRAECVCPKACSKVCSLERSLDIDVNNGDGSMMARPQFGQPDQFSFSIDLFRYLFHLGFVYFQLSAGQCRSLRH